MEMKFTTIHPHKNTGRDESQVIRRGKKSASGYQLYLFIWFKRDFNFTTWYNIQPRDIFWTAIKLQRIRLKSYLAILRLIIRIMASRK